MLNASVPMLEAHPLRGSEFLGRPFAERPPLLTCKPLTGCRGQNDMDTRPLAACVQTGQRLELGDHFVGGHGGE